MTKTPTFFGWQTTEFGSAEFPFGAPDRLYSHQYDARGRADVKEAAIDYINRNAEDPLTARIAVKLLDQEGVDTDLYQRQSAERWYVNAADLLKRAAQIREVVREP